MTDHSCIDPESSHCVILTCSLKDAVVIALYRHPRCNLSFFCEKLEEKLFSLPNDKTKIVLGDINVDLLSSDKRVWELFQKHGLKNKLGNEPTTNYGTQLDVCFSNSVAVYASVYDTYYSYHKGVCVTW